jgi:ribonuclease D
MGTTAMLATVSPGRSRLSVEVDGGDRAVVVGTAETYRLPPENLISPDYVRRLAWSPPDEISAQTVSDTLRGFGARNWQVGLIANQLAAVLPAPLTD